ncbi:MAG: hypothetical protein WA390_09360 [Nitrososphaeraceae archaeon]
MLVVSTSVSIISISIGSFSSSPQVLWAQQPPPQSNVSSFEEQHLTNGNSFEIDNTTFSHNTAFVNGIQMHYVIGGHGDPVVLLHGWP